jgi:hypothetical protein
VNATKTGTPGSCAVGFAMTYRLIAT